MASFHLWDNGVIVNIASFNILQVCLLFISDLFPQHYMHILEFLLSYFTLNVLLMSLMCILKQS